MTVPGSGSLTSGMRGAVDLSSLLAKNGAPTGSAGGDGGAPASTHGSVPSLVLEGTDDNFSSFLELSQTVPVIVDLWAEWCEPCKQLTPVLESLVNEYAGRLVLVTVDVDAHPGLSQAFQAQSIPTVAAVIAGRPLQLFAGVLPEYQLRDVFDQVLQIASENGVANTVTVSGENASVDDDGATPEPSLHRDARVALERGDFGAAKNAYHEAIAQSPGDTIASRGLSHVTLLERVHAMDASAVRSRAAGDPRGLEAQLDVADLDVAGGHIDDAFDRLLDLFSISSDADRDVLRRRLLELFDVVGPDDARVSVARRRLTSLLY